ncbi:hypothetical protein [Streptomyces rubellomurinus]|uniref:Uncharacterized protein n=1 Tax=Streptomyces rubellomurinus (strain ATCC 31215) TaxID=359131 RepID=A0A0F2T975_STRR3|nr:hypothetical protein [Streptomyces rubellomurinus]KJS58875.1 hypothetical protein VM95_30505 [Streptomyces rubellomurinus]
MAVPEDTVRDVRDVRYEPAQHGRHGRPRPFGGRFRLPTLRFSGAAMAMSTVVGISIATTLLLNEQQGVGRRAPGVARVGTTPPPTPGATDLAGATEAADARDQAPPPSGRPPAHPTRHPGKGPAAAGDRPTPIVPPAGGQTAVHDAPGQDTPLAGAEGTLPGPQQPSTPPGAGPATPSATASPSASVSPPPPAPAQHPHAARPLAPGPLPGATAPAPAPAPAPVPVPAPVVDAGDHPADAAATADATDADSAPGLTGVARRTPIGPDGLRHRLDLTVTEPVTALQAEFRLAPGESAPGSGSAWTDLPGAVVTAQQERGTLVYRFTTPPGTDVRPGRYGFTVHGGRPAAPASAPTAPAESWNAAAFGIHHPRAVAALGGFATPVPQPATR